jgi:hypothetical protein
MLLTSILANYLVISVVSTVPGFQWTWIYGQTTVMTGPNKSPATLGSLYNPQMVYDPTSQYLWIMGGGCIDAQSGCSGLNSYGTLFKVDFSQGDGNLNVTYVFGSTTSNDKGVLGTVGVEQNSTAIYPASRFGGGSWKSADGFYIYGGWQGSGRGGDKYLEDLWKFNFTTGKYTCYSTQYNSGDPAVYGTINVASLTNNPGSRAFMACATLANGDLLMFGGRYWKISGGSRNDQCF